MEVALYILCGRSVAYWQLKSLEMGIIINGEVLML